MALDTTGRTRLAARLMREGWGWGAVTVEQLGRCIAQTDAWLYTARQGAVAPASTLRVALDADLRSLDVTSPAGTAERLYDVVLYALTARRLGMYRTTEDG